MDLVRSSIRTVRDALPLYLAGRRIDQDELAVTVEVTAIFSSDEAAASFSAAVQDLLEKA